MQSRGGVPEGCEEAGAEQSSSSGRRGLLARVSKATGQHRGKKGWNIVVLVVSGWRMGPMQKKKGEGKYRCYFHQ